MRDSRLIESNLLSPTVAHVQQYRAAVATELNKADLALEILAKGNGHELKIDHFKRRTRSVGFSAAARQRMREIMRGKHIIAQKRGLQHIPKGISAEQAIKAAAKQRAA